MVFNHPKVRIRRHIYARPEDAMMSICLSRRESQEPYQKGFRGACDFRETGTQVVYEMRTHQDDKSKARFIFWYQRLEFKPIEFVNQIPLYISICDCIVEDDVFMEFAKWLQENPEPLV